MMWRGRGRGRRCEMAAGGRDRGRRGGGGRGRPGALPALGAAHTKGCRENTEGSGGCGVASPGTSCPPLPSQLCVARCPHTLGGVPVPSTASPCPAPHSRARGPVPVSGGAGGARPVAARRDGSVGLSTAQLTAPPSSRHRRAQLSIGCRRYRDSRPCVPRDLLGQPRCGGREHAVSPGTGRFCAGPFV